MSVVTSAAFICLSEQRVNAGFGVAGFRGWLAICAAMICGLFITDFLSLLETRYLLGQMGRSKSALMVMVMIQADIFITGSLAVCGLAFADFFLRLEVLGRSLPQPVRSSLPGVTFGSMTYTDLVVDIFRHRLSSLSTLITSALAPDTRFDYDFRFMFYAAFFTSLWLWLYAGSGFILKAARRFDIGFEWFNRKFDIEKKPLQSIGLVAGALVAVLYWAVVIVGYFI
jgi:hypothetical protein